MDGIFESYTVAKVRSIKGDFIDKLHSQVTVTFLFAVFILTFLKQTSGSAIYCWFLAEYGGSQAKYIQQFCWINSTYWYPNETNPENFHQRHDTKQHIPYYQFTLFIILFQCLLFYLPSCIWRLMASNSISYINKLLDTVTRSNIISSGIKGEEEVKKENNKVDNNDKANPTKNKLQGDDLNPKIIPDETKELFKSTFSSLIVSRKSKNIAKDSVQPSSESPIKLTSFIGGITFKYMIFKVLNLANIILQLLLIGWIFGTNFAVYGFSYVNAIWSQQNPLFYTHFPILTLCDFYVHMPNHQIHPSTAQCILTINVLVEKLYILIWFWFVILLIITVGNIIGWLKDIYLSPSGFILKYLNIYNSMHGVTHEINIDEINNFRNDYLRTDGYVMLLIVKSVAGDIAFTELLNYLWKNQSEKENK